MQWTPVSPAAIAAVNRCDDRLYNRFDDGGYLLWFVPDRKVFIDNRQEPYPLAFMQEHIRRENSGDYKDLFARYGIHCAFLPPTSPTARRLEADGWPAIYRDDRWVVLATKTERRVTDEGISRIGE